MDASTAQYGAAAWTLAIGLFLLFGVAPKPERGAALLAWLLVMFFLAALVLSMACIALTFGIIP